MDVYLTYVAAENSDDMTWLLNQKNTHASQALYILYFFKHAVTHVRNSELYQAFLSGFV